MQKISFFNLYFIFVKIGAILLGGGYVILPILLSEFVEKRKFITEETLLDYFAISQSLPGIIAANISMFIGYKLKGVFGAILAMCGIITVPTIIIIFLASIIINHTNNIYIQAAFWGIGIAVIALISLTIREIWQKTNKDLFFYTIFFLALISLIYFKFTPIQTILIYTSIGIICKFISNKEAR